MAYIKTIDLKPLLKFFFLFLLISDISYSFVQHLSKPLDGDMPDGILETNEVRKILNDPFGVKCITEQTEHANPNRFFAHWMFSKYFRTAPFLIQKISTPINSIYYSCAIAKIAIQIGILLVFVFYITGTTNLFSKETLIVALIITPLFQTNGYQNYMGVIDPSTTYSFFYALPCLILLVVFLPFFHTVFHNKPLKKKWALTLFYFLLIVVVSFSGPLIPGIVLIISAILFFAIFYKNFTKTDSASFLRKLITSVKLIPKHYVYYLLPLILLTIYSFYIGSFNSINNENYISLYDRYLKLPSGIYYQLTQKLGLPLLILMILINTYLIRKKIKDENRNRILLFLRFISVFSIIYILMLPFGGYRLYRPNILRYDTILPITLFLLLGFGMSTYYLIKQLPRNYLNTYSIGIALFLIVFTIADEPEFKKNECEKSALNKIAKSKESVVFIDNDCTILDWQKIKDKKNSESKCMLLQYWKVIDSKKYYYQK